MSDLPSNKHLDHGPDKSAEKVLEVVRQLVAELHPHGPAQPSVSLNSALDRDLGLDSLARVELISRLEHTFAVHLPEALFASAQTPADLWQVIGGRQARRNAPIRRPRSEPPVAVSVPSEASTLVEVLDWHARRQPHRTHVFVWGDNDQTEDVTYAALAHDAMAIAAGLQEHSFQPGQRVALMLPTGHEFLHAFFGILLAGGVPVPLYPPARLAQIEDHLRRQAAILINAGATGLITVPEARPIAWLLKTLAPGLGQMTTVADLYRDPARFVRPTIHSQDIALLQYTSGSTGHPKGVVLTHANLLANIRAMGEAACVSSADVFVSWLPLYHDMGLIGAWLGSLYHACRLVLMSPLSFLGWPARWLWAIDTQQGTLSAAPNFAFELCLTKLDERNITGLDLSSWRLAFNGAEPVSPQTLQRFTERFARYGLRHGVLTPVYGLAESSVGLAFPPPGRGPLIDTIERERFLGAGKAVPTGPSDPRPLRFVACGRPLPGHEIRIVDSTGHEVPDRQEGRLQFHGPSATAGYFRNPEETRRLVHGPWLDSGDLAYMAGGEVYLTGRTKDVIIRAGRNIYPQELEEAIGRLPGLRRGSIAVFGAQDRATGTERLVVLAETRETADAAREALRTEITRIAFDLTGTPPDDVVLAPPHTVLKTSSGKVRRAACRTLYEGGEMGTRQRAVWWQFAHLALSAARVQCGRSQRILAEVVYATYVWILFWMLAPPTWFAVSVLPRLHWRRALARAMARLLIRLSGTPFNVQGLEHLPPDAPYVVVANHASYLDGIVLCAALPARFSFVAKAEQRWIASLFLRRIGARFVARFDTQRGVKDAEQLASELRHVRRQPVVVFPEGTFTRAPGLLPFHLGAFVIAAAASVPVVPTAIHGTRAILRDGQWFPRRGRITVTVCSPLMPEGRDWLATVKLRDAAREALLCHLEEPDLAP